MPSRLLTNSATACTSELSARTASLPVSDASASAASFEPAKVKTTLLPALPKRRTIAAPMPRLPPS